MAQSSSWDPLVDMYCLVQLVPGSIVPGSTRANEGVFFFQMQGDAMAMLGNRYPH